MLEVCRVVVAVYGVHAYRHHVGATAVGEIGIAQRGNAAGQQTVVGIHELDIFAPCLADAPVAGCRRTTVVLSDEAYLRMLLAIVALHEIATAVGTAVIDDHHLVFVSGKSLLQDAVETCADVGCAVI